MKFIFISILSIFFFLGFCCCNQQSSPLKKNKSIVISDSLIYDVINYLINHKEINRDIKSEYLASYQSPPFIFSLKSDSLLIKKLDNIFSVKDLEFIFSQKKQAESFVIDKRFIKGKKVINRENLDSVNSYSSISFPLFNLDRSIVIIKTSHYCGAFCGHQGIYLYKWNKSKLVLLKILQEDVY